MQRERNVFADPEPPTAEVSRRDAEARLIEGRNRFLGFLRKRLNSSQDAEDVFQDFCVKVLRNHNSVKSGERLDAWLGVTLRHALTDHYRRKATRNRGTQAYVNDSLVLGTEAGAETEAGYFDGTACKCVYTAMQGLDPAHAELLTRLDLRDEPRNVVAAELGVSRNALAVRIHRIRATLKKRIAKICPVCGKGGFMQCSRNDSCDIRPVPPLPRPESTARM